MSRPCDDARREHERPAPLESKRRDRQISASLDLRARLRQVQHFCDKTRGGTTSVRWALPSRGLRGAPRAMASVDLSSSVIDLEGVRDDAAAAGGVPESRPGRKALVLDPHVGPTVMRLATMATLRAHDVDRLYYLEGGTLETTCAEVMFVVRPRLELMHKLAEVVASVRDDVEAERANRADARRKGDDEGDDVRVTFTACFVPRRLRREAVLSTSACCATSNSKPFRSTSCRSKRTRPSSSANTPGAGRAGEDVSSLYARAARALHELQRRRRRGSSWWARAPPRRRWRKSAERMRREQAIEDARARDEWPRDARGHSTREGDASSGLDADLTRPPRPPRPPPRPPSSARARTGASTRGSPIGARVLGRLFLAAPAPARAAGTAGQETPKTEAAAGARRGRTAMAGRPCAIDGSSRSIETDCRRSTWTF